VFLTATTARPALPLGALRTNRLERAFVRITARMRSRRLLERILSEIGTRSFEATANTMLFNETGQPAMSVPLHVTSTGEPIGVQLVARYADEATLFRLAGELETASPWAGRAPPMALSDAS